MHFSWKMPTFKHILHHKSCLVIDIWTNWNFLIISDSGPTTWHMSLNYTIYPYKCKIAIELFANIENAWPLTHLTKKFTKIFFYNFQNTLHMHCNILYYMFIWQKLHSSTSCFRFSRLCEISTRIVYSENNKINSPSWPNYFNYISLQCTSAEHVTSFHRYHY